MVSQGIPPNLKKRKETLDTLSIIRIITAVDWNMGNMFISVSLYIYATDTNNNKTYLSPLVNRVFYFGKLAVKGKEESVIFLFLCSVWIWWRFLFIETFAVKKWKLLVGLEYYHFVTLTEYVDLDYDYYRLLPLCGQTRDITCFRWKTTTSPIMYSWHKIKSWISPNL